MTAFAAVITPSTGDVVAAALTARSACNQLLNEDGPGAAMVPLPACLATVPLALFGECVIAADGGAASNGAQPGTFAMTARLRLACIARVQKKMLTNAAAPMLGADGRQTP